MKYAFYPGTFDPIHNGHISITKYIEQLGYKVLLIPAYDSPWKPGLKDSFKHRINMIQACNLSYLDIEKDLPTPSFTYQTIEKLHEKFGKINLIIGMDQFINIDKWFNSKYIKDNCYLFIIPRLTNTEIEQILNKRKMEKWSFSRINITPINISSSDIRNKIINNQNIDTLVPFEVLNYIELFDLYK